MPLTKQTQQYVLIGAAAIAGLAVVAYFGRSSSASSAGSGVSEAALRDVLSASTQNTQSEDQVTIARVQAAANTLTTLKYLQEQVQLGNISLQQAQAQYASAVQEAQINAGMNVSIAQIQGATAIQQSQLQEKGLLAGIRSNERLAANDVRAAA